MKIDDRSDLGGVSSSGVKDAAKVENGGKSDSARGVDRAGSDRAELSGLAGKIARATSVDAKERAEKVERLRLEVAEGRYHPNAAEISKAIVNDALTSAATAGGTKEH